MISQFTNKNVYILTQCHFTCLFDRNMKVQTSKLKSKSGDFTDTTALILRHRTFDLTTSGSEGV